MTCFYCKGQIENQISSFMTEVNDKIIIVRNVPSQVCRQCGEVSYSRDVALRLEEKVKFATHADMEISISSYKELAA